MLTLKPQKKGWSRGPSDKKGRYGLVLPGRLDLAEGAPYPKAHHTSNDVHLPTPHTSANIRLAPSEKDKAKAAQKENRKPKHGTSNTKQKQFVDVKFKQTTQRTMCCAVSIGPSRLRALALNPLGGPQLLSPFIPISLRRRNGTRRVRRVLNV